MLARTSTSIAGQLTVDGVAYDVSNLVKPKVEREEHFYPTDILFGNSEDVDDRHCEYRRGHYSFQRNAKYAKPKSCHNVCSTKSLDDVEVSALKEGSKDDSSKSRGRRWSSAISPSAIDKITSWKSLGGNGLRDHKHLLKGSKSKPPPPPDANVVATETKQEASLIENKSSNLKKPPTYSSLKVALPDGPAIVLQRRRRVPARVKEPRQPDIGKQPGASFHSFRDETLPVVCASHPEQQNFALVRPDGSDAASCRRNNADSRISIHIHDQTQDAGERGDILTIEIAPGVSEPLRGSVETTEACNHGNVVKLRCFCCDQGVGCVADAAYILCPGCKVVSPVPGEDGEEFGAPRRGSWGVGLGFLTQALQV